MTESQKQFLKAKGFKVREQLVDPEHLGKEEWYLEKDQRGEIIVSSFGTLLFHFYRECYQDMLSLDSIANALDYYKCKLDELEMGDYR